VLGFYDHLFIGLRCHQCEERFPSLILLEYHKEDEDHWSEDTADDDDDHRETMDDSDEEETEFGPDEEEREMLVTSG
jgi:hypothetical protein